MKVLIVIDAPALGAGLGRAEQTQRGIINGMLKLLGSRIELGSSDGVLSGDGGAMLRWRMEPAIERPAEGEEAA